MARRLALRTKVLARAHEAGAEEVLPETVHDHAGRERVLTTHEPLGETESVARQIGSERRQNRRRGRFDLLTRLVISPTHQDEGRTHLLLLLHDQRGRNLRLRSSDLLLQSGCFFTQPTVLRHLRQAKARELLALSCGAFGGLFLRDRHDVRGRDQLRRIRRGKQTPLRRPAGILDTDRDRHLGTFERLFEFKKRLHRLVRCHREHVLGFAVVVEHVGMRGVDGVQLRFADFEFAPLKTGRRSLRRAFEAQRVDFARWQLRPDHDVVSSRFLWTDQYGLVGDLRRIVAASGLLRLQRLPVDLCRRELFRPRLDITCGEAFELIFDRFELRIQRGNFRLQLRRGQFDERRRVGADRIAINADALFRHIVEEGLHRIEVLRGEGIELVIVAAAAVEGLPHPHGGGRLHAVGGVFGQKLLRDDAAFLIEHVIAMKPRGNLLLQRRPRQQIPRDLLDGELVKRHVRVESLDHPVAPRPQLTITIHLVAIRIRKPRRIHPTDRHVLAIVR